MTQPKQIYTEKFVRVFSHWRTTYLITRVTPLNDEPDTRGYMVTFKRWFARKRQQEFNFTRILSRCTVRCCGFTLAPHATSRDRRKWQIAVDENKALLLHHHQLVRTAKDKLDNLMCEVQRSNQFLTSSLVISGHREDVETRVKWTVQKIRDTQVQTHK